MAETKSFARVKQLVATPYFQELYRACQSERPIPCCFDPEDYMDALFEFDNQDGKLTAYLNRELVWAEHVFQRQLVYAALITRRAHGKAGASGPIDLALRIRGYWE